MEDAGEGRCIFRHVFQLVVDSFMIDNKDLGGGGAEHVLLQSNNAISRDSVLYSTVRSLLQQMLTRTQDDRLPHPTIDAHCLVEVDGARNLLQAAQVID